MTGRDPLSAIAREISMSLAPALKVGRFFSQKDQAGRTRPIKVVSGCYLDPVYGRVSNFWTWREVLGKNGGRIKLGPQESGYGGDEVEITADEAIAMAKCKGAK